MRANLTFFVHGSSADSVPLQVAVPLNAETFMHDARAALVASAHMLSDGDFFGSIYIFFSRCAGFPAWWEVNYVGDGKLSRADMLRMLGAPVTRSATAPFMPA